MVDSVIELTATKVSLSSSKAGSEVLGSAGFASDVIKCFTYRRLVGEN